MWSRQQVEDALPAIRRLKAIESAGFYDDGILVVTTKGWTLRHPYRMLPLAKMDILISPMGTLPRFRYANPFSFFTHWHPVIEGVGWQRAHMCRYEEDYNKAWHKGPLEAVRDVLYMMQSIRDEDEISGEWLLGTAAVGIIGLLLLAIYFPNL